jgi:hypothetical protein
MTSETLIADSTLSRTPKDRAKASFFVFADMLIYVYLFTDVLYG